MAATPLASRIGWGDDSDDDLGATSNATASNDAASDAISDAASDAGDAASDAGDDVPPRSDAAAGGAGDIPPRYDTALCVPLMYLQATTLPPVDWQKAYIIGANFRLVPDGWIRWRASIDRDSAADGRCPRGSGSEVLHCADDSLPTFTPCKYSVGTLLTIVNPLPGDAVLFSISATAPVKYSEVMADAVVRVLAGDTKVDWLDSLASWFNALAIPRHVPDDVEAVLRDMKPSQITVKLL